jgi:hypothetical protein
MNFNNRIMERRRDHVAEALLRAGEGKARDISRSRTCLTDERNESRRYRDDITRTLRITRCR